MTPPDAKHLEVPETIELPEGAVEAAHAVTGYAPAMLELAISAALPAISTAVLEDLKDQIRGDLYSEEGDWAGPLGERIAESSGNYSPEFTSPQQVAYGFCHWLDLQIAALSQPSSDNQGKAGEYECPVCHRPLMGPNEVCNGAFTERDHPTGVKAVPTNQGETG